MEHQRQRCTALLADGSRCNKPHDPGFTLDAVLERRGHVMCDYHQREAGRHALPLSFWQRHRRMKEAQP